MSNVFVGHDYEISQLGILTDKINESLDTIEENLSIDLERQLKAEELIKEIKKLVKLIDSKVSDLSEMVDEE